MKTRKSVSLQISLSVWFTAAILLSACGATAASGKQAAPGSSGQPGQEVTELRYQGSVGSVTYPELAEDLGYLAPLKLKFIGNTISGPQDIQATVTGDTDFGGAFNGAIVKLIAAKAPIKAVISYYGVDDLTWTGYYVLDDSPIRTARDLIGKKIAVNTLGAHHEFVIKEYLRREGLTSEEIKQVTLVVVPPVTSEQTLRANQIDVATLGGILRDKALERGGIRPLFTDRELFGNFSAGSYVITDKFVQNNPNTVRKFVEGTAKAIEWARTTPRDEVIARYAKIIKERNRKEDATAIQFWKSTGIAGKGGLIAESEFSTWVDWLVKEGELRQGDYSPDELYTNAYNPYDKPE